MSAMSHVDSHGDKRPVPRSLAVDVPCPVRRGFVARTRMYSSSLASRTTNEIVDEESSEQNDSSSSSPDSEDTFESSMYESSPSTSIGSGIFSTVSDVVKLA